MYPNVEALIAELPDNQLARALVECFRAAESKEEATERVRQVLERRRSELQHAMASEGDFQ